MKLMLTDRDIAAIENLMKVVIDQSDLVTKSDLEQTVSHLPTKDEFYAETEKIYKKLEDIAKLS